MTRRLVRTVISTGLGPLAVYRTDAAPRPFATVLVHGAAGSWRTWEVLLAAADRRGDDLTEVIAVDLPGWGVGSTPLPDTATLAEMRRALVTALDACGVETWRLVGHSMGGLLVLDLAADEPQRTVAVVAVSPSADGVVRSLDHPWLTLAAGRRGGGLPALVLLAAGLRAVSRIDVAIRVLVTALGTLGALRLLSAPLFRHPWRVPRRAVLRLGRDLRPRSFTLAVRSLRGYRVGQRWAGVTATVVTVEGDRDVFVGEGDAASLQRAIPGAHRIVLDDCGHFPQVEKADFLAELLWP